MCSQQIGGVWSDGYVSPTPSTYALTVTKSGTGSGTITSNPAGINCGATCSASLNGTATLTATPASGSFFYGWGGACSGTGSCVVTMDAARNVTATFKPELFVATKNVSITETSATISTTITFNVSDVGKTGAVYVTAWVPSNGLGALGILAASMSHALSVTATNDNPYTGGKINTRQETLGSVLAATDTNTFVLVQLTSSGWQLVENGQLIPYASGVLGDALSSLSILNNTNPLYLLGAQFCVGYGTSLAGITSAEEMIAAGRMMPVADIPGATATTSGSCNVAASVNDRAIEFYHAGLNHYFMTANLDEAKALDAVGTSPTWQRTGKTWLIWKSADTSLAPVCRFFGTDKYDVNRKRIGANSHFYTADAAECTFVKTAYQTRANDGGQPVTASSQLYPAWTWEENAFYAKVTAGACPSDTTPIYRLYNNGQGGEPNHRYYTETAVKTEMLAKGWVAEPANGNPVMCGPLE